MSGACRAIIQRIRKGARPGAPRIHGELRQLGIEIAQATVAKCLRRPLVKLPSQTWRTFISIEEVVTAPRAPWQNPFVERVIGSLRRECLDHLIVWNERSLCRHLRQYLACYHEWRTHLSLDKDAPVPRAAQDLT